MTPRQDLLISTRVRLKILRRANNSITAHDAIESVIDDCKAQGPDTLGAAILEYYRNASDLAVTRLIKAVERSTI